MRGIRHSDRILIAGQTGKGKTVFALWLIEQLQPVRTIIFDPKDELDFGVVKARTPGELAACMHQPVVHYVPASFDRDSLEEACQIVWITPGPYLWVIEEANEMSNPSWCPTGLRLCVTQGRAKLKMVIAITQRLAECHPVFRSQSEHVIVFTPAPIELDLKTIAGNVRREASVLDAELGSLHGEYGDYSHLWYVRDTDELRRCAPLPAPAHTRPQLRAATAAGQAAAGSPPCESDSASAVSSESASSLSSSS